ncbi:MAG: hypothetical protein NUV65_03125 [Candidatus Roizmanbacteria bacterium]|nr:hypothetical protein [Candidatus Roizmanbacteria bacterium]
MPKFDLTKQTVEVIIQSLNAVQIQGSQAEFIIRAKQELSVPLEEESKQATPKK